MAAHTGHGHDHAHGAHSHAGSQRALLAALIITGGFAVTEALGGALTGSLALLADAGHMATDVLALALSLFAAWAAARPSTPRKTYGYRRAEILAALANGVALIAVSGLIVWQAVTRLSDPPEVDSTPMLLVAVAGLIANLVTAAILMRGGGDGLNARGAMLHVAGDALGSVGAIGAGLIILATGWEGADAAASILIALLVLVGSWRLMREAIDVLLEGTPAGIDMSELRRAMLDVPGVATAHDLHVWTVTSGYVAMSGHAELDGTHDTHAVLDALTDMLSERFHIAHVTIQPEPAAHAVECCDRVCEPVSTRGTAGVGAG